VDFDVPLPFQVQYPGEVSLSFVSRVHCS
jgi:hypothetical protein